MPPPSHPPVSADYLPVSSHHIRLSIVPLGLKLFFSLFLIDLVYAVFLLILLSNANGSAYYTIIISFLWIAHGLKFFAESYFILYTALSWGTTHFYIREGRLIRKRGVIKVDENIYEMRNIRSVDLYESWLGRALNYGDLHIFVAASGYRDEVWLRGIADARKYERVFMSYLSMEQPGTNAEDTVDEEMKPHPEHHRS